MDVGLTPPSVSVGGIQIARGLDVKRAAAYLLYLASERRDFGAAIHLCNSYTVVCASQSTDVKLALESATLNLPDGLSILIGALLANQRSLIHRRVPGPDLFAEALLRGQDENTRHYLLGSTLAVVDMLRANIEQKYPRALIVGSECPTFDTWTESELHNRDALIRQSQADIVWIGLGTPKQDLEVCRIASSTATVAVGVGAAFEFLAGTVPRAPKPIRGTGLEWLYRLWREPRRLWRRYTVHGVAFLRLILSDNLSSWRRTATKHRTRT